MSKGKLIGVLVIVLIIASFFFFQSRVPQVNSPEAGTPGATEGGDIDQAAAAIIADAEADIAVTNDDPSMVSEDDAAISEFGNSLETQF